MWALIIYDFKKKTLKMVQEETLDNIVVEFIDFLVRLGKVKVRDTNLPTNLDEFKNRKHMKDYKIVQEVHNLVKEIRYMCADCIVNDQYYVLICTIKEGVEE